MKCDQCQMLAINGHPCHELGCPNTRKRWIEDRQEWVRFYECRECGDDIEEGEICQCGEMPIKSAIQELAERVGGDPEDSDFIFGMEVFCRDFHAGQWSLEYAASCEANVRLTDNAEKAIRRGKYDKHDEWEDARNWYRALKRDYYARNKRTV